MINFKEMENMLKMVKLDICMKEYLRKDYQHVIIYII